MPPRKQYLILLLLSLNFYSNFIVKSNEVQSSSLRRIIAIGDLHGDYKQTIKVLRLANMIDDNMNWSGKNGILVQVVINIFLLSNFHPLNFKRIM